MKIIPSGWFLKKSVFICAICGELKENIMKEKINKTNVARLLDKAKVKYELIPSD